ncbi:MAG TPA: GNAT family N-acetyltransferase [Burkholderiaceae bacterium]|nr:GNAT family N-acetyltransferase [Burkholderiaceae bacterium]
MNTLLRIPVASDYDTIASWIPDSISCARWAGPHFRFPFVSQELPELLAVPNSCSFSMAQGNGVLLGFGQFWRRDERSVHLGRIIVSPHERGRGYGKTLCNLLIAEALNATNAGTITLRVYRDNAPAFSIYSNLGFLIVESESNEEVFAMEARANPALQRTLRNNAALRP